MSARVLASPAEEIRRLRAERDGLRRMVADLVGSLADPAAEIRYRGILCTEAYQAGYEAGEAAGNEHCAAEYARAWRAVAGPAARGGPAHDDLEILRWGPRGREHYGDPREGDYPGGVLPHEHAGMVWLAGPVVHRHPCTAACRAYTPGWYAPAEATAILAALPGTYPGLAA